MWDAMNERAAQIADTIRGSEHVLVVTHIDADGLSAGAIADLALERAGIPHDVIFIKQLDKVTASTARDKAAELGSDLVWFTDLGSGQIDLIADMPIVISDHHVPSDSAMSPSGGLKKSPLRPKDGDIVAFLEDVAKVQDEVLDSIDMERHLNPYLFDGGSDVISGAGCAYLVARALVAAHTDLAVTAIIGAVGDLQDRESGRLIGINRHILEDAMASGRLEVIKDLTYYGMETRPVSDFIAGATSSKGWYGVAKDILKEYPLEVRKSPWILLDEEIRIRIRSNTVSTLLRYGEDPENILKSFGERYVLVQETVGTQLHDAKEFATLLNACGRYGYYDTALQILRGDREEHLKDALSNALDHKRVIKRSREYIKKHLVTGEIVDHFHSGEAIPDTVLGSVVGGLIRSCERPIIGFADSEDNPGMVKVSSRSPDGLPDRGLDLSMVMNEAAGIVGGVGGGHKGAAGALIPKEAMDTFLDHATERIRKQLG